MAAEGERGIAAAVEEEQGLLTPLQIGLHLPDQGRRQPAAARRRVLEEIDRGDVGHFGGAVAAGPLHFAIDDDLRHLPSLDRGRGRGANRGYAFQLSAPPPYLRRVILGAAPLVQ